MELTVKCTNCKRTTNTFLSDYSVCTETKKAGIVTECYLAFEERWVKGCGYDNTPQRKRNTVNEILMAETM